MITVAFLKFPKKHRWYAITQMGRAHGWLQHIEGCSFYKLMGSGGGNGFSIFPDLSTYCLLMGWEDAHSRDQFFIRNQDWLAYKGKAHSHFVLFLQATKVMGEWGGVQPFSTNGNEVGDSKLVVLTRATIKKRFIPFFWSKVPKASAKVNTMPGHLFSKGVGEVPLLHQATISVWENKASMHAYAYQDKSHISMIRMTREKGWYSEELFAEFQLLKMEGEFW